MEMFRPDITGTYLYMDLDTMVKSLPDDFFRHPTSLAVGTYTAGSKPCLQSSMMLLHERDRGESWGKWMGDPAGHMRQHRGDQDFLQAAGLHASPMQEAFPQQVCSYKLNWLPRRDETGKPLDDGKVNVVCFHGKPRPWDVVGSFAEMPHRPRSCILVGNGPSILSHKLGKVIDGFEEVVRFNAFAIRGFEESVGTKTTVWSTFGHKTVPKDDDVRPDRVLFTHGESGEPGYPPRELIRIPRRVYGVIRKLVQSRSELPAVEHLIPSSGLLVAWWYLEAVLMPKISVIGFDHFAKDKDSRHHYWNPQIFIRPKEHDGDAEARIIQDYVDKGRIERLG